MKPLLAPEIPLLASVSVCFVCFDCGVTLNEKNHTNKDNVLDANEAPQAICDDCSEERWKRIKWHDEETPY